MEKLGLCGKRIGCGRSRDDVHHSQSRLGKPLSYGLAILLSSCAASSPWALDSLASAAPGSKRLVYSPTESLGAAKFELSSSDGQISAYFSTSGRRFGAGPSVPASLSWGGEKLEEELPLHEGRMRVRLPESWTRAAIEALKDGKEVAIIVGSIEQTVEPEFFEQLAKEFFR